MLLLLGDGGGAPDTPDEHARNHPFHLYTIKGDVLFFMIATIPFILK